MNISRPTKWRIVESIPQDVYFIPQGKHRCELTEEILKVEEIEAIRLKDLENLNQNECAEKMKISRPTFQRILTSARTKITRALIEGKALRVQGGDFTQHICKVFCNKCEHKWEESFENFKLAETTEYKCPNCGADEISCCGLKGGFCKGRCE